MILESILGGGITGLLGTVFDRVATYLEKDKERKFILEKYQLDMKMRAQEHENEMAVKQADIDAKALQSSFEHDVATGQGSQWVINILRLVRPVITASLWLLTVIVWFSLEDSTLEQQIVGTILYCATASTLWWFGTRDNRKNK